MNITKEHPKSDTRLTSHSQSSERRRATKTMLIRITDYSSYIAQFHVIYDYNALDKIKLLYYYNMK